LLEQLFRNEAHPADAIAKHMGDPLPTVGSGEPVAAVVESLSDTDAVVVLSEGRPIGVLTRQDLLHDLTNFAGDRPTS
jgi:cystathionine beta-synthase